MWEVIAVCAGVGTLGAIAAMIIAGCVQKRRDRALLADARASLRLIRSSGGYDLAVRFSVGSSGARAAPICIPNGLAATMALTGVTHDALNAAGFSVLSFDRAGVGFSEAAPGDKAPSVDETVRDMAEIMDAIEREQNMPQDTRWILLGPSMGNVVAQCFMLHHQDRVAALLNIDGFPAPFTAKEDKFLSTAGTYKFAAYMSYTGVTRFVLALASSKLAPFATTTFPLPVMLAQMAQPQHWKNTALEFKLMMDLAKEATIGWGSLSVLDMSMKQQHDLANAFPANCGSFVNGSWIYGDRSVVEHGSGWLSQEETDRLRDTLTENLSSSELGTILARIPVRVMSARDYNYPGGDSFYDEDMKRWAASEHSVQALIASDGARYVFPKHSHMTLFQETDAIVQCAVDLDQALRTTP